MGSKLATIHYQLRYGGNPDIDPEARAEFDREVGILKDAGENSTDTANSDDYNDGFVPFNSADSSSTSKPDTHANMTEAGTDTTSSLSVHPAPNANGQHGTTAGDAADLTKRNYLKWTAPGVESIPEGEAAEIQRVATQFNTIQKVMYDQHRHCYTGTHARTQGVVKGTFTVHPNLPPHLAQGELFDSGPQEFPLIARYSTEPGDPSMDDRVPTPRGFAMKLFGVKGEMFDAGADTPTQDIEFNSTPALDLATAKVTREIVDLRMCHGLYGEAIEKEVKKRDDAELQMGRYQVRQTHLSSTRQYSQTAYRFGEYVCKYCLVPSTETQKKMFDELIIPDKHDRDVLHKWLGDFHRTHDAEYLFQVQLLENLEDQPVEYAGKVWDPEKYPWQTIATVRIPKQESFDYERKAFWEDHLRVDPWLGLKAYQPLGGSNRLRRVVYPASSNLRRKMNGRREIHVKTIDEFPA